MALRFGRTRFAWRGRLVWRPPARRAGDGGVGRRAARLVGGIIGSIL